MSRVKLVDIKRTALYQSRIGISADSPVMIQRLPGFLIFSLILFASAIGPSAGAADGFSTGALTSLELENAWRTQAVMDPRGETLAHFLADEEVVIVVSSSGSVTAMSAESGRELWVRQLGGINDLPMPPATNDDILVVTTGPVAWGVNKFSGDVVFRQRLKFHPTAGTAVGEQNCYFPMPDGSLHAYSISTLEYKERYNVLPPTIALPSLWQFNLNEKIRQPPAVAGNVVVFATETRNVHAVSGQGESFYQQLLNARITAPPVIDVFGEDEAVIVSTADRNLYSFNLTNGRLQWYVPVERPIYRRPMIFQGRAYFVMGRSGMSAVSTKQGRYVEQISEDGIPERWFVPGVKTIVGLAGRYMYGVDVNRRLVAIDPNSAKIVGAAPIPRHEHAVQNAVTDRIYLATANGHVMCLKPIGSRFATFHQRPDKEPLEVEVPAKTPAQPSGDTTDADSPPNPE